MKTLTILGRRWFDRVNGNTYHSVRALVDGVEQCNIAFAYGYGDHYQQTAAACLTLKKILPDDIGSLSRYCRENGIELYTDVVDVERKKHL